MPGPPSTLSRRLYLASACILLVGWIAAALIFATAVRNHEDVVGYRIVRGEAFPTTLEQSKIDVRSLRADGGEANVAAAEFDGWAGSLWRGKPLSYSLVVISTVLAGLCAGIARSVRL